MYYIKGLLKNIEIWLQDGRKDIYKLNKANFHIIHKTNSN